MEVTDNSKNLRKRKNWGLETVEQAGILRRKKEERKGGGSNEELKNIMEEEGKPPQSPKRKEFTKNQLLRGSLNFENKKRSLDLSGLWVVKRRRLGMDTGARSCKEDFGDFGTK